MKHTFQVYIAQIFLALIMLNQLQRQLKEIIVKKQIYQLMKDIKL